MNEYYSEEFLEETPREYLERICYIRNFDTPKKINELKDEIDVLRSAVETLAEREKTRRMGSVGAISSKRE
jgi:hypothetical protein